MNRDKKEFLVNRNPQKLFFTKSDVDERIRDLKCQTQANLFKLAARKGYDIEFFTNNYLKSEFCQYEMDGAYSSMQFRLAEELMEIVENEIHPANGETGNECLAAFLGYMYRWLNLNMEINSYELAERVPYNEMIGYACMANEEPSLIAEDIAKDYLSDVPWREFYDNINGD